MTMDDYTNAQTDQFKTDSIREDNALIQDRTIAALFDDADNAREAKAALESAGYEHIDLTDNAEDRIDTDAGTGEPKAAHEHGFWQGVKDFFSDHDDSHVYGEGVRRGNTLLTLHTQQGRAAEAVQIIDRFDPVDLEGAEQAWRSEGWSLENAKASYLASPQYGSQYESDTGRAGQAFTQDATTRAGEREVIPVVEENLVVGKHDVEGGNVRVRSYVRNVPVNESVTLRQENVNVERRPVDRPVTEGDTAFQDRTIEARAVNEEAVVGKTARVVEEVVVSKDVSQTTKDINDTVRKTEVEVDENNRDRVAPVR